MPDQFEQYYKYLKANGADVAPDFNSFKGTLSNYDNASKYYSYLKDNQFDVPETYDSFADTFGLKKKDQAVSLSVSSPTQSLSPDFEKGKAFAEKGFLMQPEGIKVPKEQEVEIEPVEKQGLILNTISSLDKAFAKGFSSPIKALGTALQGTTKKVLGGTGEGFVSDALIKFGDYLNNTIDELTPQDEEFKGTLVDQVAQAFGQVGSLVLTGGLTGAAGKGAALVSQVPKGGAAITAAKTLGSQLASPTAVSAGLSMGQAEFDRAIEAGANDDQAFEAFYKNAATGSVLETIPVMQFFKRFNNSTGGSVANYIKTKGVAGLTGGIEEMTTEVMQQLYSNKTAKDIYNINQDILDGVGSSGGIGFGVGFLLNAMGANAKILRKQGKQQEADVLENQVKQYEDNIENPKVTSGNKVSAKDIVTKGVEIGTQKAFQNLDRDLANNVITPEQYQEGIVFAEKAAQVADKIPETVTGESRVKSIELLVDRNDINQANQNLLQQKQTTDVAYHAGIDEEIKANEERIKKLDTEVYNIAKKPSKEFGGKTYVVDGEEVSQAEFEVLQGKPIGTKEVIKTEGAKIEKAQKQLEGIESINPNAGFPIFNVGQVFNVGNKYLVQNSTDKRTNQETEGVTVISKIIEPAEVDENGKMIKSAVIETTTFDSKEDAQKALQDNYNKYKAIAEERLSKAQSEVKPEEVKVTEEEPPIIEEYDLKNGDIITANIAGVKEKGKVIGVGKNKGEIVIDFIDENNNERFVYANQVKNIQKGQAEIDNIYVAQKNRLKELLNKEELSTEELSELDQLNKAKSEVKQIEQAKSEVKPTEVKEKGKTVKVAQPELALVEPPKKTYQEAVKEKLEADKKRNREAGAEKAIVTKEIYRKVDQMDAPADAEQVALRYLADGGNVSKEAVDEAYGSVKRAELNVKRRVSLSEEVKSKDFVQGNETLDDLAHRLWEANNQKIPEDKIKDKLMAEIGNNNSRLEAAEAYLDKYNAEYKQEKEELRLSELYKEQYLEEQDEIEKELRKPLDEQIEGEATEEHINNLINQYEAEIKGQDQQLRPASEGDVSKEAGKGKVAEKTSETELAKEYKEATGKASKKAKENAKKDFVDRNFDNIVEKLKIQIKCPT